MSDYKEIKGKTIQYLGTDPSDTGVEGQVWYNSTAGAFKSVIVNEAWSSGTPVILARAGLASGSVGTQTSALIFGGRTFPPESYRTETEEYNGSGWSSGGAMNTARQGMAGFGTQTSAVAAGGDNPGNPTPNNRNITEEYDGSTWTSGNNVPVLRYGPAGSGTLTAGLKAGGLTGTYPFAAQTGSEEYDGTSWTAGGTLNTARGQAGQGGTQTTTIAFGGQASTGSPNLTAAEQYDGSTWTSLNSMNTGRALIGGAGDTSSAIGFGGTPATNATETYDGTSWATSPATLGTGREWGGSAGNSSNALYSSGRTSTPVQVSNTEEYNKSINVITAAAWSSGGNMNTSRRAISGGAGTATAGMSVGGYNTAQINSTEEYDGSTWTNSGNYPSSLYYLAHGGTQTAAWAAGGGDPVITTGNNYDGSTWTASGSLPAARKMQGRAGTQTAGVFWSGNDSGNASTNTTDEYDGSTWTSGNTMNKHHGSGHSSGGSQTAAVAVGGTNDPNSYELVDDSEFYDGTSWTTGPLSTVEVQSNGGLNQSSNSTGIAIGGYLGPPGTTNAVAIYDGSVWSTGAYFPTNIQQQGGFGDLTAGVVNGGNDGAHRNETVEYVAETTAANIVEITTS
jgi:hypothetical protein